MSIVKQEPFPESDQTPWGRDPEWDQHYVEELADRWQEGVSQAQFIIDSTKISPGSRILDLGCGAGRQAVTFARAGCDVVGIDISEYAIEKAREVFRLKNLKAEFITQDFRKISYRNEFDMVVLLDNTFGILCEEENRWLLRAAAKALRTEGLMIIDTYNREHILEKVAAYKGIGRTWGEGEGRISSRASSFDLHRSRYNTRSESMLLKTGKKVLEPVRSIRLYTLCEMILMLEHAGMEIINTFGGPDGSEYTLSSERMVIISKKAAKK